LVPLLLTGTITMILGLYPTVALELARQVFR